MNPRLELRTSRVLTAILTLGHLLALVCVLLIPLAPLWQGVVGAAVVASALWSLLRHAWRRTPSAVVGIELTGEGTLQARRRDGATWAGRVLPSSFVSPFLSILNVQPAGSRWTRAIVITADAIDPAAYRRLRVRLRWGRPEAMRRDADHERVPRV